MQKEADTSTIDSISPEIRVTKVMAVVEDSADCAEKHKRHLLSGGADQVIIFRSPGALEQYLEEGHLIDAIITDGLEGEWAQVSLIAGKKNIPVTLITGNQDFILTSGNYPNVKAISKAELYRNPKKYKDFIPT